MTLQKIIDQIKKPVHEFLEKSKTQEKELDLAKITGLNVSEVKEWFETKESIIKLYRINTLYVLDILIHYAKTRGTLPSDEDLSNLLIVSKNGINPFLL